MEFQNAVDNLELTKVFCLPLRPKADEKIAAGFGAVERWSGGAEERAKRSGVHCLMGIALCAQSELENQQRHPTFELTARGSIQDFHPGEAESSARVD